VGAHHDGVLAELGLEELQVAEVLEVPRELLGQFPL